MRNKRNNFAFIDSQNLYLGIHALGWKLDFSRFRKYLTDKYGVSTAFLFIGYIPSNEILYANLCKQGFELIFKQTNAYKQHTKGNVDAELILHALIKTPIYSKAILVTGDGDFLCLAEYLISNSRLEKILVPNKMKCAQTLQKLNLIAPHIIDYLELKKDKLRYK